MNDKAKVKEEVFKKIKKATDGMNHNELVIAMGAIRAKMLIDAKVTSTTHFVCPVESKVVSVRAGKKIMTEHKITKTCVSKSWYYLSRKAYNKVIRPIK